MEQLLTIFYLGDICGKQHILIANQLK